MRPYLRSLTTLVATVCIGCVASDTNSVVVQAVLAKYSVGDMHSQMADGLDEWHDGATFMIEKPEKWKDTPLTVFFPSEVKDPVLRPWLRVVDLDLPNQTHHRQ